VDDASEELFIEWDVLVVIEVFEELGDVQERHAMVSPQY
jgi:hypothetical protein